MYIMCLHFTHMLQASVEAQTMQAQNAELKIRETSAEEIRRIRHDIKNQYTYMDVLLTQKRYDDLARYFDGMKINLREANQYIDCGNKEVNSMLNMEQEKAQQAGFSLEPDIAIPAKLGIDELDLSVLLINIIDNAIESNVRYGIKDPIKVSMKLTNDFLSIRVGNRLPQDADTQAILSLSTSKKKKEEHGIGHRIVDNVCSRHDGVCERRIEGNVFWTEVVIQAEMD